MSPHNRFVLLAAAVVLLAAPLTSNASCVCLDEANAQLDTSEFSSAVFVSVADPENKVGKCFVKATSAAGTTMLENHTYRLPGTAEVAGGIVRNCLFDSPSISGGAPTFNLESNSESVQCAVAIENFARRLIQAGVPVTDGEGGNALRVNNVSGVCVPAVAGG